MAHVRTFIAVDVGDAVRSHAADLQRKLGRTFTDVKWVDPENIHLTLLFLGEVDELEVLRVCRAVAKAAGVISPFQLAVEGVGAFPTVRRPKVLWLGVTTGKEEVRQMHDRLEAPLLEMGAYRREDRAYTPHLTLGRINREDAGGQWAQTIAAHERWHAGETTVDEVLVMSSELRRDGPAYTVLSRAPLGRSGG